MSLDSRRQAICPPGGGGALAPWIKIVATDQGVAPIDTAAQTTTGTGFTAGTGRFRIVYPTGLTTLLDGHREALPRWSINLLGLIPDFDHLTDILDICQVFTNGPALSATVEKFFPWHGVFNENIAGLATQSGQAWGLKPNTTTQWNHGPVNETSDAMGNVMTGTPAKLLARYSAWGRTTDAGYDFGSFCRAINTIGETEASDTQSSTTMDIASHPLADWTIQTGGGHDTTVGTAGADHEWELWYRRIKTSGFTGLP
jgi:hypothetical protein